MKTGLYYTITQPITRCSLVSYSEDVSFQPGKEKKMCWVIYYHLVFFLRWHILKSDLHVDFIDLIIAVVKRYVCKKKKSKAWDLIDVSVCTEEILMNCLSFPLYNSINMPDTRSCFFTCIRLNLIGPSFSSDSCKWRGCLCTSQVNRSRKKAPPGICLTVWALGPFNLAFLGLLPATLYVCNLNGAQLLLKSPEESSLQRRKKKLLSDDTHGAPRICLEVRFCYMSRWSALQLLLQSPQLPRHSSPKWSNGNRSKLRVNCFTVAAQQINKHLEAFRVAH